MPTVTLLLIIEIDIIIENLLSDSKLTGDNIKIDKKFLYINSKILEKKYLLFSMKNFLVNTQIQVIIGFVAVSLITFITGVVKLDSLDSYFWINVGISIFLGILALITFTKLFKSNLRILVIMLMILIMTAATFNSYIRKSDHLLATLVVTLVVSTNYNLTYVNVFWLILLNFICYIINFRLNFNNLEGYLFPKEVNDEGKVTIYSVSVSMIAIATYFLAGNIFQRYYDEKIIKNTFLDGSKLLNNTNQTSDILSLLLPKFVLDLMEGYDVTGKHIGEDVGEVCVIFCDIADFDRIVREREKEIVSLLDELFREFDDLATIHGIQKIETVGKTYLACSGLKYIEHNLSSNLKSLNPTTRTLNFAKDLMGVIKKHKGLKLKIGIHTGPCMMGVIGYHKPQFSLIGDTVNTTSRHCTTGMKGHIMISQEARKYLSLGNIKSGNFKLEEHMALMKGKGQVSVLHVVPFQGKLRGRLLNALSKDTNKNSKLHGMFKNKKSAFLSKFFIIQTFLGYQKLLT